MTKTDAQKLLQLIADSERDLRPRLEELRKSAYALMEAARTVGESWSGSCMGSHALLYYGDFQKPHIEHIFNVEWGLVMGLQPGWEEKSVKEITARIISLSGINPEELEKGYEDVCKQVTGIRDETTIQFSWLSSKSGFDREKSMLATIEELKWDRKDHNSYVADVMNGCPKATRDFNAITSGRRVPVHSFYEGLAYRIGRGCDHVENFWRNTNLLIRRLQITLDISYSSKPEEKKNPVVADKSVTNIYNLPGPNARVNVQSEDSSINIGDLSEQTVFKELRNVITRGIPDTAERKNMLGELDKLEQARGTKSFAQRYQEFIAAAANHITLFAPLIPALTKMLGG